MAHTIKNKQIRVTDKETGELFYFRGKRKDDAIKALVDGRFEAVYLTGDELFQDIQAGRVKTVVDLSENPVTPPAETGNSEPVEEFTPAAAE